MKENNNEDNPPWDDGEENENLSNQNQPESGANLEQMNQIVDFLNAKHPDIEAFLAQVSQVDSEKEDIGDEEANQKKQSKEEENERIMQNLGSLAAYLDECTTDSEVLKKFKRLVREKLNETQKLADKMAETRKDLDKALQYLSEKMQELMEKIQSILANAPKIVRVFELGIPQADLNAYRQKLSNLQSAHQNKAENPYLYFQSLTDYSHQEMVREKIALISMRGDVEAFRFLQQLEKDIAAELRGWTRAALLQAQMQMENSLSDEPIVLLASGLGGVGNLVRHLCFVPSVEPLTEGKALFVRQEFENQILLAKGKLETFSYQPHYIELELLLPYQSAGQEFVKTTLENCQFLIGEFWITSLAKPTSTEINQWIDNFLANNTVNLSDLLDADDKK